ncbi:recombination regulator RecX [Bacillus kwashiorkori]|uniref:recombination regulator RecX n=1 Tax=Bacillus kwashiorkori TaxID=1522318 RepID=UPI0007824717|nr:recombination regulator RecX [Bacillus kwashiorkori]
MPVIARIAVQKRNQHRFNVYINGPQGEEYAFSISEDQLVKHALKKGQEIDHERLASILYEEDVEKSYHQALNYLSYRMRSVLEVRQYLSEKEVPEDIIDKIIKRLQTNNYLNDKEFAEAFVKTKIKTSDHGPNSIKRSLAEKGIRSEIIEDSSLLYDEDTAYQNAMRLAKKYAEKKKHASKKELQQLIHVYLSRKGYKIATIHQVVTELFTTIVDRDNEAITVQGDKAWRKYGALQSKEQEIKVKQFLFRKGFSFEVIEEYIRNKRDSAKD